MILHFRQIVLLNASNGDYVDERRCIEYPRITHLQQSSRRHVVTTFFVHGVDARLGSLFEALDVLRRTLQPGEIVAVPPLGVVNGN